MLHRMVSGNDIDNMPLSAGERPSVPRGEGLPEPPDPNNEQVGAVESLYRHWSVCLDKFLSTSM